MPRYFFHVHHRTHHPDDTGIDLPGKDEAWKEATFTAGQLIQDLDGALKPGQEWRLEVTDEAGNPICVLHVLAERR
ncbi:DUF6894 family protein [Bradyrhizobium australafricanum]|uniref:DUF6894 family protein n=1 Tax=Bradyrhizobium australafricanum TaxID=2821406 RepID=UPI001CE2E5B4|nr:hypothetical protein [Bradyrhizobium australafricanum]MCA6105378.1 hypothetical protein [Bradyrhizobium australafricanum]